MILIINDSCNGIGNLIMLRRSNAAKVSLIYCTKTTTKSTKAGDNTIIFGEFRPTWVFEWNTEFGAFSSASIKVDAISGEITIDANTLTVNELQKEKANE